MIGGKADLPFRLWFWRLDQVLDGLEDVLHFAVVFAFAPFQLIQPVREFRMRGEQLAKVSHFVIART